MSSYSNLVKERLNSLITRLESSKEDYIKQPGKNFTRNRKLDFKTTVKLILSLGAGSLGSELLEYFDYDTETVSVSAFTQKRDQILPDIFKVLLDEFTKSFNDYKTYKGYRVIAVDGSDLLIPSNPKDNLTYFNASSNSKGFNLIHINALYDVVNKIYVDAGVQPGRQQNEHRGLIDMVDRSTLENDVLILADRGFEGYNSIAHIMEKGWKFLIRVKDINSSGMLSSFNLPDKGEFDEQIERIITRKQTKEIKANPAIYKFLPQNSTFDYLDKDRNIFYPISFRVVKVELEDGSYQCFITNLDSESFSLDQIRVLYHMRWGIETSFRELKHALALTHLHTKKEECIIQEVFSRMVMYNFCSIITSHVVIKKKQNRYGYQINFSKAIKICRHYFKSWKNAHLLDVEALIQKFILPVRQGRSNPRKVKYRTFVSFNYRVA